MNPDDTPTLSRMAAEPPAWLSSLGPLSENVISTRIRLARNLVGHRFPPHAREEQLREVLNAIRSRRDDVPLLKQCSFWEVEHLSESERRFFLERRLLSPDVLMRPRPSGLFVAPDEGFSVIVNEEDHLRLQSITSGLRVEDAWRILARLDDQLNDTFELAFSREFGYLTSCPTNTGTGMRVSVFVHLPALVLSGKLEEIVKNLGSTEFTFRGFYGEGTQAVGNIFQVSNQVTLGRAEEKILERLRKVAEELIRLEKENLTRLLERDRLRVEDVVFRAVGVLGHARYLGAVECVNLLSNLRLGMSVGFLPPRFRLLSELIILTQPAHLRLREGRELSDAEVDRARAVFVRESLKEVIN